MIVNIYNQTETNIDKYSKVIKEVFTTQENEDSMELIFLTPAQMQKYNKDYRQIDKPTDVLSFPNDDEDDDSIGDIFINLEQALAQAKDYDHSDIREVAFLAVHGYLHLLGYDHENEANERLMFNKQEEILKEAGIERE